MGNESKRQVYLDATKFWNPYIFFHNTHFLLALKLLFKLVYWETQRARTPICWFAPQDYADQSQEPRTQPHLPCGWYQPNYLSDHWCLSGSVLAGSWRLEPEQEVELRHSDVHILSGILTVKLSACTFHKLLLLRSVSCQILLGAKQIIAIILCSFYVSSVLLSQ